MALPIKDGKISTKFGIEGPMWSSGKHEGVDFAYPLGTNVYACADGEVVGVGAPWGAAYGGHSVLIHHPGHGFAIYAHLRRARVAVGDTVEKGQHIGDVGAEGNVTGPHLHLELQEARVWKRASGLNPAKLLKA